MPCKEQETNGSTCASLQEKLVCFGDQALPSVEPTFHTAAGTLMFRIGDVREALDNLSSDIVGVQAPEPMRTSFLQLGRGH